MSSYQVIERQRTNTAHRQRADTQLSGNVQWRDTAAVMDGDKLLMAVAIGPDGMVWSYQGLESHIETPIDSTCPQATNPTLAGSLEKKPKLRCTHLCADTIAVGFDKDDRPVVFAALGSEVQYATCLDLKELHWSQPKVAEIDMPETARGVERILSQTMNGQLHVGAMIRLDGDQGPQFNAAYAVWNSADQPSFRHTPVYVDSLDEVEASALLQQAADSCYARH